MTMWNKRDTETSMMKNIGRKSRLRTTSQIFHLQTDNHNSLNKLTHKEI